ncbi:MAG TPA: sodium-dependent transporter [Gemmatimonadaceae bacterium]|nr:sodium-dependent transporter [Gemmatimonadaceae bacterium]
MSQQHGFSSRLTMMLAMLSMAVGTGNIWRFPRIAATNGGGEFLVAWALCLFTWSIPLILIELGMGRLTRRGSVGAFVITQGKKSAWMGGFIALVAIAIMWYYSVVCGWTLRYFIASAGGQLTGNNSVGFWRDFSTSYAPVLPHIISMLGATFIVARGVKGIERATTILMPILILIILGLTGRALMLPGASDGLAYLFTVDWHRLGDASLWLQALTQNAWDTGAGWGLVLCYAAYMRQNEDTALNGFILPAANNMISLCAGMMVFSTVFTVVPQLAASLASHPEALADFPALADAVKGGAALDATLVQNTIFNAGNEGVTFIWIPKLFATLPGGRVLMSFFFLALFFAAFTSLISMVELGTRVFLDMGWKREKAVWLVGLTGLVMGLPSAFSIDILHNQDWVWGIGLMMSGFLFAYAVIKYGVTKFREEQLNHAHSDIRIGAWWDVLVKYLLPFQAIALMLWWMWQVRGPGAMNPFGIENIGTILFQWGIALILLLVFNKKLGDIKAVAAHDLEANRMPPSIP